MSDTGENVEKRGEEAAAHSKQKEKQLMEFSMKSLIAYEDPKKNSVINTISLFVDEHRQYIQYGLYTLGLVGVAMIGRSIKAFTRFADASSIPQQFYKDKVIMFVKVKDSDIGIYKSENVPKLRATHIPLIQTPFNKRSESNLSILVPGLHISSKFREQSKVLLRDEVKDRKLKIRLLESFNDSAVVEASHVTRIRKSSFIGQKILQKGYAEISGNCGFMSDKYLAAMRASEAAAKRRRLGMWKELTPLPHTYSIFSHVSTLVKKILKRQ